MEEHLNQARHNEAFLAEISEEYYDWRVTLCFYIAVHYLRAFAEHLGADAGNTHEQMESRAKEHPLHIKEWAWKHYKNLKHYSREARYDGFSDKEVFLEIQKGNFAHCLTHLAEFKKYLKGRGLPIA